MDLNLFAPARLVLVVDAVIHNIQYGYFEYCMDNLYISPRMLKCSDPPHSSSPASPLPPPGIALGASAPGVPPPGDSAGR